MIKYVYSSTKTATTTTTTTWRKSLGRRRRRVRTQLHITIIIIIPGTVTPRARAETPGRVTCSGPSRRGCARHSVPMSYTTRIRKPRGFGCDTRSSRRARVTTAVDPHDSVSPPPTPPSLTFRSTSVISSPSLPRGTLCRGRITQVGTDHGGGSGGDDGGGRRGTAGTPERVPSSGFGDPKTRRDRETPPTYVPTARWRRYSTAVAAVPGSPFTHICCSRIIRPGSGPRGGLLRIVSRLTSPAWKLIVRTDHLLLHHLPLTHLGGRTEACGV